MTRRGSADNSKNLQKNDYDPDSPTNKKWSPEAPFFLVDKTSRSIWPPVSTWLTVLEKAVASIRRFTRIFAFLFLSLRLFPVSRFCPHSFPYDALRFIIARFHTGELWTAGYCECNQERVAGRKMRLATLWVDIQINVFIS